MVFKIEYLADHMDAIPGLARAHQAEWAAITPHVTVSDRAARFQARAGRGGIPTGFVAVVNGTVVGLACLVECELDSHCHLSPWLASVVVEANYRGRGIGAALSERVAEEAAALGLPRVFLVTLDKQNFYRRLGWLRLEETTFFGCPATVMVRELNDQRVLADDGDRLIE